MADVEYFFEAASCGFSDRSARSEAFEFLKEKLGLTKRDSHADIVALEDLQILVAMFDGRDDRQSCEQIIDRLGRDAEAAHTRNCSDHSDIACAEKFKIIASRDGRPIKDIRLSSRKIPDHWREAAISHKQEMQVRTGSQSSSCGAKHLSEAAPFDELTPEHRNGCILGKQMALANCCAVDELRRRHCSPDRCDEHPLRG